MSLRPGPWQNRLGCQVDSLLDRLTGNENPSRLLIELGLLVLLLHVYLITYLLSPTEPEPPAKPLVMDVALIAAQAPPQAKPTPPTPPAVPVKPRTTPIKPKKTPVTPKKTKVIPRAVSAPAPQAAPAAKPEAEAVPAQSSSAPSSPAISAPSRSQPKSETFTEANYRANYKSNPKPQYPHLARSRGWQGKVLLRVEVTANGRSAAVTVQQSSGHEQLDNAAIEAVENWTFIPAKRGDTPIASTVTVPIQFKLND